MSATARYALAFLAATLVGALLGSLVFGVPLGPIVGACVAVVLVAFTDPRIPKILANTYNMYVPFCSSPSRRDNRDD
jgi:glycerol uptake facilitator-like aquaporin